MDDMSRIVKCNVKGCDWMRPIWFDEPGVGHMNGLDALVDHWECDHPIKLQKLRDSIRAADGYGNIGKHDDFFWDRAQHALGFGDDPAEQRFWTGGGRKPGAE